MSFCWSVLLTAADSGLALKLGALLSRVVESGLAPGAVIHFNRNFAKSWLRCVKLCLFV
jgi:hypothetical protein